MREAPRTPPKATFFFNVPRLTIFWLVLLAFPTSPQFCLWPPSLSRLPPSLSFIPPPPALAFLPFPSLCPPFSSLLFPFTPSPLAGRPRPENPCREGMSICRRAQESFLRPPRSCSTSPVTHSQTPRTRRLPRYLGHQIVGQAPITIQCDHISRGQVFPTFVVGSFTT